MRVTDKQDALGHIDSLYPIGQSDEWDRIWLDEIDRYGIDNLPEDLLIKIAQRMVDAES
jgi:hypothetical protein